MSGTGPKRTKRSMERDLILAVAEEGRLRSKLAAAEFRHAAECAALRSDLYDLREAHAKLRPAHDTALAALGEVTRSLHDAEADRDYYRNRYKLAERFLTPQQLDEIAKGLYVEPEAAA